MRGFLILAFLSSVGVVTGEEASEDQRVPKICDRITIWHWHQFEQFLRGCTVIEGSLQINILFDSVNDVDSATFSSLRFPELKEITGFLMVFFTENIVSLSAMFPSLSVIRGQELVEKYALVISKMPDMVEVGLVSLTHIFNGGVWIVGNDKLCFVDSIDWHAISGPNKNSSGDIIVRKNGQQCSNFCSKRCKYSVKDAKRQLCWSEGRCQLSATQSCPNCSEETYCFGRDSSEECCHSECAGACHGPEASDCEVCKNVGLVEGGGKVTCRESCPPNYFEYLERRCLTRTECLNISSTAPNNHPTNPQEILRGKIYKGDRDLCVLDCPLGSQQSRDGSVCVPCEGGRCHKVCEGGTVDTIEAMRRYSGCTRVGGQVGYLKIHFRSHSTSSDPSGTLVSLLKDNLGQIEIIDDYLLVSHTYALYSLDFLESLRVIGGKVLSDNSHALVIKSNENMKALWSQEKRVEIANPEARIMFHYNPQLCPDKIYKFLSSSGVNANLSKNPMDIGITNGDKVNCNTKELKVRRPKVNSTCVTLQWENFRLNLTEPSYLLNYEIHYKVTSSSRDETKLAFRDPCGQDGWNIMDVSPLRDANGAKPHERFDGQPAQENPVTICHLLSYTNYAFYIKAVVLPASLYASNNNTGAESSIIYVKTVYGVPESPADLTLQSQSPDTISVTWTPPLRTNGPRTNVTYFKISLGIRVEPNGTKGGGGTHLGATESLPTDLSGYCESESGSGKSGGSSTPPSAARRPLISPQFSTTLRPISHTKNREYGEDSDSKSYGIQESEMLHVILGNHLFTGVGISPPFASGPNDHDVGDEGGRIRSRRKRDTLTNFGNISDPTVRNLADQYKVIEEVIEYFNASAISYTHQFKNLKHYTNYHIVVQTCRKGICSDPRENLIRTAPSPSADLVQNITHAMVNSTLHLSWDEPSSPNGAILAYIITFKGQKYCISRDAFLLQGDSYIHPEPLYAGGNYSVRIQTKSKSGISPPSNPVFVLVEDIIAKQAASSQSSLQNPTWLYFLGLLLIFFVTGLGVNFVFMHQRAKRRRDRKKLFVSLNPEYTPIVHIPRKWEIPRENLEVKRDEILGTGSFGTVFLGVWKKKVALEGGSGGSSSSGWSKSKTKLTKVEIPCAVKELNEDTPSLDKADLLKEALLMTRLDCPHVIKLLGIVSLLHPILVVMEYMPFKDLRSYLISMRPNSSCGGEGEGGNSSDPLLTTGEGDGSQGRLTPAFLLSIAASVADGMAYIHTRGYVHRDLAARNCMVDGNLRVKVGDFGLSKEMCDYYRLHSRGRFPFRWMAPECFLDNLITYKSDVWSYGVLLYEIASLGAVPYHQFNNLQVKQFVCSRQTLEMPETSPPLILRIAQDCFNYVKEQRPSFLQILERLMVEAHTPEFEAISFYHSEDGVSARNKEIFDVAFFNGEITIVDTTSSGSDTIYVGMDDPTRTLQNVEEDNVTIRENSSDNEGDERKLGVKWKVETAQVHFSSP
ncbi:insulin-like peptide receptor isoform X1 [Folsomia candida]|uniref:insulin-like peptide receptor isoform X1 n=1 Tax=Folsomia candida TaxID=158441 RepID=UPI000B900928|nr:insulin-like peptide receptor isoform X1 [Folsomia candida]